MPGPHGQVVPFAVLSASVVLAVSLLAHYYLYRRLARTLALDGRPRRAALLVAVGLGILLPLTVGAGWLRPFGITRALGLGGNVWAGLILYGILLTGVVDLLRLASRVVRGAVGRAGLLRARAISLGVDTASRRSALGSIGAAGVALATGGAAAVGIREGLGDPEVTDVEVPLRGLRPGRAGGLVVAHLSDLHAGTVVRAARVRRIADMVNGLRPDLVVLTGDIVDRYVDGAHEAVGELRRLDAPLGVWACTGNHEYWGDVRLAGEWLSAAGVTTLRNRHVTIDTPCGPLDIVGVDDHWATRIEEAGGARLDLAVAGRDASVPAILLCHQPRDLAKADAAGIGLQLSGHLHGGQMFPFGLLQRLAYDHVCGLHRLGDCRIYVNRGLGTVGPPLRVAAPSEVARIRLVPGGSATFEAGRLAASRS